MSFLSDAFIARPKTVVVGGVLGLMVIGGTLSDIFGKPDTVTSTPSECEISGGSGLSTDVTPHKTLDGFKITLSQDELRQRTKSSFPVTIECH